MSHKYEESALELLNSVEPAEKKIPEIKVLMAIAHVLIDIHHELAEFNESNIED